MEYQVYLFDFDYTLANSEKGIVMCFQKVLKQNGYGAIKDEAIKRTIGLTLKQAFMLLTGAKEEEALEKYRREYSKEADVHMTDNTTFFPETVPMLEMLAKRGKQVGIISTKHRYRIEEVLKKYGVEDKISLIIGGDDVKEAKPSPEGIFLAMDRLSVKKEEVLYIGDSMVDANTAHNAGVDFVAVTTGTTEPKEFEALPFRKVIDNLGQLLENGI